MITLTSFQLRTLICLGVLVQVIYSAVIPEHDSPKETHKEDISSQVSWYSIFWALFALAVNSMGQPSLLDKHISPSTLLFPSHSSPIACLADTGDVILYLFIRVVSGESFQEAARSTLWRRARERIGSAIDVVEETTLERFPIATAILFIGPLSQAIKLYGCEGIIWAKVIASMYLSSYVVLTLLTFLAPRDWRNNPPTSTTDRKDPKISNEFEIGSVYTQISVQSGITLVCIQPLLYLWFINGVIEGLVKAQGGNVVSPPTTIFGFFSSAIFAIPASLFLTLGVFLAGMVPFNTLLIAGSFTVRGFLASSAVTRWCYFGSFVLVVPALVLFCYFCYPQVLPLLEMMDKTYTGTILLGSFCVGICMVLIVVSIIVKKRGSICRRAPFLRQWFDRDSTVWLEAFAVFNIGVMLMYLVKGYDPAGTVKPAWTDRLG